jgi:hypothetical protein
MLVLQYHRSLTCIRITKTIVLLILAGCTTATSPHVTQRPETRVEKPPVDSSTAVDVDATTYAPGRLQYYLRTSSVVDVTTGDSIHRADSTLLTGILTVTLVAGPVRNTVIAHVQPDSVSVATGSGTSIPILPRELLAFSIDIQTGRVAPINREVRRDCPADGSDSSPIYGHEVLPSIHTRGVQTWTDTVYTSTCRGGALLTIARIASYTRLQSVDSVLRFLRLTHFQITGTGRQWDQRIEVSGEGTSTDTLHVSGSPLRLQAVFGGSQTKLSFRTQLRAQEFIQTSTTRITLHTQ